MGERRRNWNPEMKSKLSIRFGVMFVVLSISPVIVKHDWRGFIGTLVLLNGSMLAVEGLASLWPTVFGRRPNTWWRVKAAWRSLNGRAGVTDD